LATIFSLTLAVRLKIQQLRFFSSGQLAIGTLAMVWVLYQSRRTTAIFCPAAERGIIATELNPGTLKMPVLKSDLSLHSQK